MPRTPSKPVNKALLEHDLVKLWLQNATSANTRSAQATDLNEFFRYIKINTLPELKEIERADVMAWRDSMPGTKANPKFAIRSIKRKMSTVSKFIEFLLDEGFLETNPFMGITTHSGVNPHRNLIKSLVLNPLA